MSNPLVLSLFPGVGLLDMAFEEAGFTVVRGPDVLWGGDVRRFHPTAGVFEGVIGGPPCQSFSPLANLVRARGYEPRFGNLIPEFERCVAEAAPAWFLMEEVIQAPAAQVPGYGVHAFELDHCHLDAGDGLGLEQERKRVFSFGVRCGNLGHDITRPHTCTPPDLRRWIKLAALLLPGRAHGVTQYAIDNSAEAKGRAPCVNGRRGREKTVTKTPAPGQRRRTQAVLSDTRAVPVALGRGGKMKPGAHEQRLRQGQTAPGRKPAVTAAHTGAEARPKGGHLVVYQWQEMLRLQGLPLDFLELSPFTAEGKRKAVANGVPLPMGRALAAAVIEAMREVQERTA